MIMYYLYRYHQTSDINRTLVGNTIVDHWDVVGALPEKDIWFDLTKNISNVIPFVQ